MERLTEYDYLAGVKTGDLKIGVDERKAFDRLAAYEDTGLEPEEIVSLAKEKLESATVDVGSKIYDLAVSNAFEKRYGVKLDRMCELAEADRDGRLVVLPCKVEHLQKMLDGLTSGSSVDAGETYTTGYLYGWKNGRAELLRYILGMSDGGTREAAEAALRGEEHAKP